MLFRRRLQIMTQVSFVIVETYKCYKRTVFIFRIYNNIICLSIWQLFVKN